MTTTSPADDADGNETPVRRRFDPANPTEPTLAIVDALAEVTGTSPEALPPLGESVDTDSLNGFFSSNGHAPGTTLAFDCAGCRVTVRGDGTVAVASLNDA